ncbi:PTS sugar transporter subunit IIA [bacterium]|nr:PTS sugar transporter subunit IIA [bacterium]
MKFADFVKNEAIESDVQAADKEAVIRELVGSLVKAGQLSGSEEENIVQAVLKREELGSTGIGRGIAVPHTKHPSVTDPIGTVGVSHSGVDFSSLDGEPVNLFFMLISPLDKPSEHLQALENISKQLQDETFCRFLKQAKTSEDVKQVLEEADNNQFA